MRGPATLFHHLREAMLQYVGEMFFRSDGLLSEHLKREARYTLPEAALGKRFVLVQPDQHSTFICVINSL